MNPKIKREIVETAYMAITYFVSLPLLNWAFTTQTVKDFFESTFPNTDLGLFLMCVFAMIATLIIFMVPTAIILHFINRKHIVSASQSEKTIVNERIEYRPTHGLRAIRQFILFDIAFLMYRLFLTHHTWRTTIINIIFFTLSGVVIYIIGIAPVMRNRYILEGNILQIREYGIKGLNLTLDIPIQTIENIQLVQKGIALSSVEISVDGKKLSLAPSDCMADLYEALKQRI